jgi:hypothetical protein
MRGPRAPTTSPPPLDVDNAETVRLLALRAAKVLPTEAVLFRLGCTAAKLEKFVGKQEVRRAVVARTTELLHSGELGRIKAAMALPAAVDAMNVIIADTEAAPGARVAAANTIAKIAATCGDQPKPDQPGGVRFSLILNLGTDAGPTIIEAEATPQHDEDAG